MIKIADCSPVELATISEYEDEPFASDSEDSKKIRQAENRALAKNKNKSLFTSSSKPDRLDRPQIRNDDFQHGINTPLPPFSESSPFNQSQEQAPKPKDTCYGCGQTRHWRSRCLKTN